mmetsp:Transcript_17087/g.25762  ORF Transcript_17087/g.25762 Transcript_17087/m.25762 type:complete len:258 (+) Transcript_17087:69-842(+)|eukprot:CAMPEP_0196598002 /NCGR_PEP_ID=MMETSP1081-20130531/94050_1 /TAXON_ID=36882 /ORGANISM="Pyramimonas amylifera, Strain CCMP720" /LENGTH=257 /DNA_ID=CAMNT_0041923611 /DNA_START=869 /DNA_END=1642 /DNA_ORIENTATION=-
MFSSSIIRGATVLKVSESTPRTVSRQALRVQAATTKDVSAVDYAKTLPGVSAPFPDVFDPLGCLNNAIVPEVRRWREAELTHGRVSMLAALGIVVGEQLEDFPLFYNFDGRISGPAINQFQQVGQGFWEPLVLVIGICETYRVAVGWASPATNFNQLKDDYDIGNLQFDPLGLCPTDPDELYELKTKELNNGRLAMISVAGFVAQEFVNNTEIFQHLFRYLEEEIILEIDDIELEIGAKTITAVPQIVLEELGKVAQ